MVHNYQFGVIKINRHNFFFYCLFFILFFKYCFCKVHDEAGAFNFLNTKAVSIDSEEIIRRRNVAESYLKKSGNKVQNWIETYHESFSGSPLFAERKIIQRSSLENEHKIPVAFPFQSENFPSVKNLEDSTHQHESLFNDDSFDYNSKDETVLSEILSDQIVQESFKIDKNYKINQDTLSSDNDELSYSHVSVDVSETSKVIHKHPGESQHKSKLQSNTLKSIPKSCKIFKDGKLDSNSKYFSFDQNDDLGINVFKNLSLNTNKIIQIMLKNSEFTYKKYFINGETLTHTEFRKLQENLASLSFLQKSEKNIYSINRMNLIDSIGKVTPVLKEEKIYQRKPKQFSNSDKDTATESFCYKDNNLKNFKTDLEKRTGHTTNNNEITAQKRTMDASMLDTLNYEKYMQPSSLEKSKAFSHDSEILRRKKLMNTFIVTLNNNQENWIETYHLNDLKDKPEIKSTSNLKKTTEENNKFSKVSLQERLYIIRWINKLQNKLKDYYSGYYSLNVFISADFNKLLGDLSQEFDIVIFDELVNNMISNATLYKNLNALQLDYEYIFHAIFLSLTSSKFYISLTFLFCSILLYKLSKTRPDNNFSLYRVIFAFVIHFKWILLIIILVFSFSWHGYKMYQQKIAEKQSVMSRVVPSYCESILVKESGVIAHFKEIFRHAWYDEDCKKYYEAVMVDPSSEINLFSISTDLLSDTIFQMLQPFARNMNIFFKTLTRDLSFVQKFLVIIVAFFALIIILYFILSFIAFRRNYKVNFPFHLGSVEPTEFCKGSRVEEVEEKHLLTDSNTSGNASLVNYNNTAESKSCNETIVLKESKFRTKLKPFKFAQSKHCVFMVSRTRRNSI